MPRSTVWNLLISYLVLLSNVYPGMFYSNEKSCKFCIGILCATWKCNPIRDQSISSTLVTSNSPVISTPPVISTDKTTIPPLTTIPTTVLQSEPSHGSATDQEKEKTSVHSLQQESSTSFIHLPEETLVVSTTRSTAEKTNSQESFDKITEETISTPKYESETFTNYPPPLLVATKNPENEDGFVKITDHQETVTPYLPNGSKTYTTYDISQTDAVTSGLPSTTNLTSEEKITDHQENPITSLGTPFEPSLYHTTQEQTTPLDLQTTETQDTSEESVEYHYDLGKVPEVTNLTHGSETAAISFSPDKEIATTNVDFPKADIVRPEMDLVTMADVQKTKPSTFSHAMPDENLGEVTEHHEGKVSSLAPESEFSITLSNTLEETTTKYAKSTRPVFQKETNSTPLHEFSINSAIPQETTLSGLQLEESESFTTQHGKPEEKPSEITKHREDHIAAGSESSSTLPTSYTETPSLMLSTSASLQEETATPLKEDFNKVTEHHKNEISPLPADYESPSTYTNPLDETTPSVLLLTDADSTSTDVQKKNNSTLLHEFSISSANAQEETTPPELRWKESESTTPHVTVEGNFNKVTEHHEDEISSLSADYESPSTYTNPFDETTQSVLLLKDADSTNSDVQKENNSTHLHEFSISTANPQEETTSAEVLPKETESSTSHLTLEEHFNKVPKHHESEISSLPADNKSPSTYTNPFDEASPSLFLAKDANSTSLDVQKKTSSDNFQGKTTPPDLRWKESESTVPQHVKPEGNFSSMLTHVTESISYSSIQEQTASPRPPVNEAENAKSRNGASEMNVDHPEEKSTKTLEHITKSSINYFSALQQTTLLDLLPITAKNTTPESGAFATNFNEVEGTTSSPQHEYEYSTEYSSFQKETTSLVLPSNKAEIVKTTNRKSVEETKSISPDDSEHNFEQTEKEISSILTQATETSIINSTLQEEITSLVSPPNKKEDTKPDSSEPAGYFDQSTFDQQSSKIPEKKRHTLYAPLLSWIFPRQQ